jgi:hypothetical protein
VSFGLRGVLGSGQGLGSVSLDDLELSLSDRLDLLSVIQVVPERGQDVVRREVIVDQIRYLTDGVLPFEYVGRM